MQRGEGSVVQKRVIPGGNPILKGKKIKTISTPTPRRDSLGYHSESAVQDLFHLTQESGRP